MNRVEASDYFEFSRLSHPAVAPDGERVAYVQQTPESETDYEATVYVAPTDGGEPKRFTGAEGVDSEPAWSPSGDRIAFVSTRGANDERPQLWVVPTDGGEAEQVTDVVGGVSGIAWGPAGERIAFLQSVRPEEAEAGHDIDVDEEYEREDPDPRVIDRHSYRSHESYSDGARSHVYAVDAGGVERVTSGDVDCLRPAWGETDLYYPIRYGSDDDLRWEVEVYDPEGGETETVTVVEGWGPTLAVDASRPHDRIAYTTTPADDPTLVQTEIEVFTRAVGEVSAPTADLDRDLELWHEFQTLAARGYVVFWCNPRGSTGYGEEFMTAIERDWGDVTMQDVMAGVRDVASREYVDADDAFVTGGGFGGFMAAWVVGHTDCFAGVVAQRGVYDLTGFYGSTDADKLVEGDFRAAPWSDPEFLREQSPAAYVEYVDTPTLLVHAEQDYRTPANTAELYYRSLQKHDVDTRLVRYPREGHELPRSGEPGHVVDRIERIVRWFDGYASRHDAERALDRPRNDGLTAGEETDEGENGERAGDDEDATE